MSDENQQIIDALRNIAEILERQEPEPVNPVQFVQDIPGDITVGIRTADEGYVMQKHSEMGEGYIDVILEMPEDMDYTLAKRINFCRLVNCLQSAFSIYDKHSAYYISCTVHTRPMAEDEESVQVFPEVFEVEEV